MPHRTLTPNTTPLAPFDFSAFFSSPTLEDEDTILAEGGIFPYLAFTTPLFQFSIDVPDGIDSFTLRQIPIAVPEPVSASLMAMCGLTVLGRGARTRS